MTSSAEQKQVLDMLAEGKITAEEAQKLLEKLGSSEEPSAAGEPPTQARSKRSRSAKHLRVVIQEQDGETTNLRVPLMLVRTGLALNTLLPDWVMRKVIVNGVDLSGLCQLKGDEFLDAVHDLEVQVEGSGESVRICCE